jgi:hypothetical protein
MGIYGAFAKFSGPEFNTTLALTSTDNIDLTRQNQTAIEISADAAIHEVAINNITKSDGSPLVPSAPSGFFVEMSDADAKFFNLYDDIFGSTLDLTYMRLFVSSLPENIELRISGIVQEIDDISNPSSAEFLVFNDLMRGLNDSVSYEIDHSELALQTFTFLPQMIGEQQATLSPAATVYSRARYEYSSNVFGPYDPRLSSFTSGKGIGSTIPDESGTRQNLDSPFELNLFVMPRKERNNQYLGLYDVYNWLRTDDDFVWQTYIDNAQVTDDGKALFWTPGRFFDDPTGSTPLIETSQDMQVNLDSTHNQSIFNTSFYSNRNGIRGLSFYNSSLSLFGQSYSNDDTVKTYTGYCDDQMIESLDEPVLQGPCETYRAEAQYQNSFMNTMVNSTYAVTAIQPPNTDGRIEHVKIASIHITQNDQIVSVPTQGSATLNLFLDAEADSVNVEIKSIGEWMPLTLTKVRERTYSAQFDVPTAQVKHHLRVSIDAEPFSSVQTLNSYLLAGSDTSNTFTSDFDNDGVFDYLDQDGDNDDVSDLEDAFPYDETESLDSDKDGIGNNADSDDDNDGVDDLNDAFPLDASESVDTDNDGIGNNADTDDDGDDVEDANDAFPLDASESIDTDNDGIGNNADTDDDGDGVEDASDAFPLDASETVDTDNDGIGNNADTDDDGDGVSDANDAYPLDSSRSAAPTNTPSPAPNGDSGGGSVGAVSMLFIFLMLLYRRLCNGLIFRN